MAAGGDEAISAGGAEAEEEEGAAIEEGDEEVAPVDAVAGEREVGKGGRSSRTERSQLSVVPSPRTRPVETKG